MQESSWFVCSGRVTFPNSSYCRFTFLYLQQDELETTTTALLTDLTTCYIHQVFKFHQY